jgi:hypothetical protein
MFPLSMVVAVIFDASETGSTQSMKLQAQLVVFVIRHDVNVGLFADSDLIAKGID